MKKVSLFYRLDFFLDEDGVLWVGGWIWNVLVFYEIKYLVIFLSKGYVIVLLVRYYYERICY